jgi:hypothetical protein
MRVGGADVIDRGYPVDTRGSLSSEQKTEYVQEAVHLRRIK